MKRTHPNPMLILTLAVGLAWLAGCSRQPGPADHSDHSGHKRATDRSLATLPSSAARCSAHGAPQELCFICNSSLRDPDRLWCGEHNRYEDRCWQCHPELRDPNRAYCEEHGLYEDECFLCRPELADQTASHGSGQPVLFCTEHGVPEAECAICRPELASNLRAGSSLKVRLPSPQSAGLVGLQTARPETGAIGETVDCLAEISYNQNKLAQIVAPVGGIVQSVEVDLGNQVEEKQTVAKLWSASIAEAVAKAVLTHQTLERERKLRTQRVTSEKDLQEAEATHRAACQQLRTLGFTEEQIDELGGKPAEAVLLEVHAPFAGEIVERTAVRGALVDPGKTLFVVADRSTIWANLSVPETALSRVRTGQAVELTVDALPGRTFTGRLTWIGPAVDEHTRMARARAEIPNPDGVLRDKMFARARIVTRQADGALLVPASAIQYVGGRPLVFVQIAPDLYEARAVTLGARSDRRQEIQAGLAPQDQVVISQGFAVKSHMLSAKLGAGCAHE